jgi:hypothetical protein
MSADIRISQIFDILRRCLHGRWTSATDSEQERQSSHRSSHIKSQREHEVKLGCRNGAAFVSADSTVFSLPVLMSYFKLPRSLHHYGSSYGHCSLDGILWKISSVRSNGIRQRPIFFLRPSERHSLHIHAAKTHAYSRGHSCLWG